MSRTSEFLTQLHLSSPKRLLHHRVVPRGHDCGRAASRFSMASYLWLTSVQSPVRCACSIRSCVLGAQPSSRNNENILSAFTLTKPHKNFSEAPCPAVVILHGAARQRPLVPSRRGDPIYCSFVHEGSAIRAEHVTDSRKWVGKKPAV